MYAVGSQFGANNEKSCMKTCRGATIHTHCLLSFVPAQAGLSVKSPIYVFYFAICGSVVHFQRLCHIYTSLGNFIACGIVDRKATQMIRKGKFSIIFHKNMSIFLLCHCLNRYVWGVVLTMHMAYYII